MRIVAILSSCLILVALDTLMALMELTAGYQVAPVYSNWHSAQCPSVIAPYRTE